MKVNLITCESDFYKKPFQSHDDTKGTNTSEIFQVPIGNTKSVETFKFHNDAPILKYFQKSLNIFCLISLASAFANINQNKNANYISLCKEESLESEVVDRIDLANYI